MPNLTIGIDPGGRPIISLYVSAGAAEAAFRREEGYAVEPPIAVLALIDTGAGTSLIEESILKELGLEPVGDITLHTASTGVAPVVSDMYAVELSLAGETMGLLATDLQVVAAKDLGGLSVEVLLGRDILKRCLLVYNGHAGLFTLAFDAAARAE
jgi:predicted aspartyl protease